MHLNLVHRDDSIMVEVMSDNARQLSHHSECTN